jgi:hypothetical protein
MYIHVAQLAYDVLKLCMPILRSYDANAKQRRLKCFEWGRAQSNLAMAKESLHRATLLGFMHID